MTFYAVDPRWRFSVQTSARWSAISIIQTGVVLLSLKKVKINQLKNSKNQLKNTLILIDSRFNAISIVLMFQSRCLSARGFHQRYCIILARIDLARTVPSRPCPCRRPTCFRGQSPLIRCTFYRLSGRYPRWSLAWSYLRAVAHLTLKCKKAF